jgi:membrane protein
MTDNQQVSAVGLILQAIEDIDSEKLVEETNAMKALVGHTKTMVSAIVSISDGLSKIKPIDPDYMTAFLDAAKQVVHMLENLPLDKEIRAMDLKVQASAFQMITGDLQKMVASILAITSEVGKVEDLNPDHLQRVVDNVKLVIDEVGDKFDIPIPENNLVPIVQFLGSINQILTIIQSLSANMLKTGARMLFMVPLSVTISTGLSVMVDTLHYIGQRASEKFEAPTIDSMKAVINTLSEMTDQIRKMASKMPSTVLASMVSRVLIKVVVKEINGIINEIDNLSSTTTKISIAPFDTLKKLAETISGMVKPMLKASVPGMKKAIGKLRDIIYHLMELLEGVKAFGYDVRLKDKIGGLNYFVTEIGAILGKIKSVAALAAPLALPVFGNILRTGIKMAFTAIFDLLRFITVQAKRAISGQTEKDLRKLKSAVTSIMILVGTILLMTATGLLVMSAWKGIVANLAVVTTMIGFLMLVGFIMDHGGSALVFAASKGFALIALSVGLLTLTVAMIALLGALEIDREKVKDNITAIFDTVVYIVEALMTSLIKTFAPEGSNPLVKGVMAVVGLAATTAGLIATFPMLLASVLSISAILLIGGMLKLVSLMTLDRGKIREVVGDILSLVGDIAEMLSTTLLSRNPQDRGILGDIVDFVYPPLTNVVDSISQFATVAMMTFSVMALVMIGGLLRLIQMLELDPGKIRDNISQIFDCIGQIVRSFQEEVIFNTSGSGLFDSLVQWISPTMFSAWQSFSMFVNVGMMFGVVLLLNGLARCLQGLTSLVIDTGSIQNNICKVFDTIALIQQKLGDAYTWENAKQDGVMGTIAKAFGFGGTWKLVHSLMQLGQVATLYGIIALVESMVGSLSKLAGIDLSSLQQATAKSGLVVDTVNTISKKLTDKDLVDEDDLEDMIEVFGKMDEMYKKISELSKKAAEVGSIDLSKVNNSKLIINSVKSISTEGLTKITNSEVVKVDNLKSITTAYQKVTGELSRVGEIDMKKVQDMMIAVSAIARGSAKIGKVEEIGTVLPRNTKSMVEMVGEVNTLKIGDGLATINRLQTMTSAVVANMRTISTADLDEDSITRRIGLMKALNNYLGSIVQVDDKAVKNTKEITDTYIKFLDRLDKADLQRLQVTERMLRNWADLSQSIRGNFEGFATSINEHIAPLLKDLNMTMDEVRQLQHQIMSDLAASPENGLSTTSGFDAPTAGPGLSDGGSMSPMDTGAPVAGNNTPPPTPVMPQRSSGPDGSKEKPYYIKMV